MYEHHLFVPIMIPRPCHHHHHPRRHRLSSQQENFSGVLIHVLGNFQPFLPKGSSDPGHGRGAVSMELSPILYARYSFDRHIGMSHKDLFRQGFISILYLFHMHFIFFRRFFNLLTCWSTLSNISKLGLMY